MAKMDEIPVEMLAQWRLMKEMPLTDWSIVASSWVDSESECTERSASSATTTGEDGRPGEEIPVTEAGTPNYSMC